MTRAAAKIAYVDTSVLVAIQFHQPSGARAWRMLQSYETLFISSLTFAEVYATLARERQPLSSADALLARCDVVVPDGDLRIELTHVMAAGSLRGADAWHCAVALAIAGNKARKRMAILTLDAAQAAVAAKLGFAVGSVA